MALNPTPIHTLIPLGICEVTYICLIYCSYRISQLPYTSTTWVTPDKQQSWYSSQRMSSTKTATINSLWPPTSSTKQRHSSKASSCSAYIRSTLPFANPKLTLSCPQRPVTGPYIEPFHNLPFTSMPSKKILSFTLSNQNSVSLFLPTSHVTYATNLSHLDLTILMIAGEYKLWSSS